MGAQGLFRPPGLPPEHYLAVTFFQVKTVKGGENTVDKIADVVVPLGVLPFQPVKHGRQVAPVGPEPDTVCYVPALLDVGVEVGVVELVKGKVAE